MNYKRLIAALKFKQQRNSTYFIVKSEFEDKKQEFKIYPGGLLLFTDIPAGDPDYVFMSIIYKTKPLRSNIIISDKDEGLIKLKYTDLANLIIAKKVEAYYTDKNAMDREIYDIINENKGEMNNGS